MNTKQKIVNGRWPSDKNLGSFACSFDVWRASWLLPSINYEHSVSKGFREKHERFKVGFLFWFKNMNLKVASPEESGRVVAHENVPFSNGNCETKGSKLSEMRNGELYLKRGYSFQQDFQQDYSN